MAMAYLAGGIAGIECMNQPASVVERHQSRLRRDSRRARD
jgi:hypothetical protein